MNTFGITIIGEKGLRALEFVDNTNPSLLERIAYVVIGEDANVKNDYSEQIRSFCLQKNIRTYSREKFNIDEPDADWIIAIGWKWLINIERWKLVVLHDSLLPMYRGFNPLVTALIEGDSKIGVTAIEATEEVDKGPIYFQRAVEINYPIKIQEAIGRVSGLYGEILVDLLTADLSTIQKTIQDEENASYSLWRNYEDYFIDWSQSADKIHRFVDAVGSPYLGAKTHYNGKEITVLDTEIVNDLKIINRDCGKLFSIKNNKPIVVCGQGLLRIERALDEEGRVMLFKNLRVKMK